MGSITAQQYAQLIKPINPSRVAKRSGGGKQLSYLKTFDVRAHLIRVFGFGNFDVETIKTEFLFEKPKKIGSGDNAKDGIEVAFLAEVRLTVRDPQQRVIATYSEAAVGSADGASGISDLYDNAVKTAVSDALKRCCTNWGDQFGLSLYDEGKTGAVVIRSMVTPDGVPEPVPASVSAENQRVLESTLGATVISEGPPDVTDSTTPEPSDDRAIEGAGAAADTQP